MKVKKINSSSRRTDKAIKEAFAELLHEKNELSSISVTELVKRAGITRSAFYTHFDSIYDVAQNLQDETLSFFIKNLQSMHSLEDMYKYVDSIFNYLKENEQIFSLILSSSSPLLFADRLDKISYKGIYEVFQNNNIDAPYLKVCFFSEGCTNIITKYYRKEIDATFEELNQLIKDQLYEMFFAKKD